MKSQLAKDVVLLASAILATAVLLSFAFRQPSVETIIVPTDYSETSNAQLLKLPLTEPVCEELLSREGLETRTLVAALRRLSRLGNRPLADTLFGLVNNLSHDSPKPAVRNISFLVLHVNQELPDDKEQFRAVLLRTAITGNNESIRKVALAGLVSIDGSTEAVFAETRSIPKTELIQSLSLVNRFCVAENLYDCLRRFIVSDDGQDTNAEWKAAAIRTAVEMPDVHSELAADLAQLLRDQNQNEFIAAALMKLPVDVLPQDQLGFIAAHLIAQLAEQSGKTASTEVQLLTQRCLEIGNRLPADKRLRIEKRVGELVSGIK